jgi:hypothetical protein
LHRRSGGAGGGAAIHGMGEDGQHSTGVTTTLTKEGPNQEIMLFFRVSFKKKILWYVQEVMTVFFCLHVSSTKILVKFR